MYNEATPVGMLHVKITGFHCLTVLLLLHHKQNAFNILNHRHDSIAVAGTKVYTSVRYSLAPPDLRAVRSPQNLYLLVSFSFFLIPFPVLVDSENSNSVLHAVFLCSNPLTAFDFER